MSDRAAFFLNILLRIMLVAALFFSEEIFMVSIKIKDKMTVLQAQLKLAIEVKREFTML